jgi:hypothetical protein
MKYQRLLFAFSFGLGACSSSPSSSGPNLNSATLLVNLSTSDQKTLCDWWAKQYGGYGQSISCGSGLLVIAPLVGPTDEASCASALPQQSSSPTCAATVGNEATCVQWTVQNGCKSTSAQAPADCNDLKSSLCKPP